MTDPTAFPRFAVGLASVALTATDNTSLVLVSDGGTLKRNGAQDGRHAGICPRESQDGCHETKNRIHDR